MLPQVDSKQWCLMADDRHICVVGRNDFEVVAVKYQPDPAAAKLVVAGVDKQLL